MNTKNIKTVIIILLLIANIYFIYNIISLKIDTENISPEMIEDAVNILEKKGFIIDRNKIPEKKPANWIYEGEYMQNRFADIIKDFSGVSDEEIVGDMFGPLGMYYTAGDYKFIFSEADSSKTDRDDFFKISIIDRNYSDSEKDFSKLKEETEREMDILLENGINESQKNGIKKAEKIIKNFIKKYQNQDVKLGFEIRGFEADKYKNCECVVINQTVDDGLWIDSHIVYVEIQDGAVKYFWGNWYFGKLSVFAKRMPLLDSINVLFKCWESDENIVQGEKLRRMNREYNVIPQDAEKFFLAPSWQLVFESGRKLSYDMISGKKRIKS